MKFSLLSESNFLESQWSGGSTNQLFIFPEDSSYAGRSFLVRISTAKVEVPESTFTALPRFSRKLMILEGEITINHENQYTKVLKPFEVDSFSGDWTTTAVGTCVDFNVMTAGRIPSDLSSIQLSKNESTHISVNGDWTDLFIFSVDGRVEVKVEDQSFQLEKGNLFCAREIGTKNLLIHAVGSARLVLVKVDLN